MVPSVSQATLLTFVLGIKQNQQLPAKLEMYPKIVISFRKFLVLMQSKTTDPWSFESDFVEFMLRLV